MKTIYYYQTFCGLNKLYNHIQDLDVIIISSLHFGVQNNKSYIHLNNNPPTDNIFDNVWYECEKISAQGVEILVMLGGAGGAYEYLFSNFEKCYPMLKQLISSKSFIKGIDLDIEENVNPNDVKKLIQKLVDDFGEDFIITMAPVSESLIDDGKGFGGFSYKDLYKSSVGKYINWFNTQCYDSFTEETYSKIIDNGYPPDKVVFGMLGGDYENFNKFIIEIQKVYIKFQKCKGAFIWEYINSPPDKNNPSKWCSSIKNIDNDFILI